MSVPDRVPAGSAGRNSGGAWLVWMAVGVALAFVGWTAAGLAVLPPLPLSLIHI